MSAYLMVSLYAKVINNTDDEESNLVPDEIIAKFSKHDWWDKKQGWKNLLNNLRLVIQPFVLFNLLKPWLIVFPISHLSIGFSTLIALMNQFRGAIPRPSETGHFLFSSAFRHFYGLKKYPYSLCR